MLKREMNIADYDAELWQAMEQEKVRQEEHIELIASENYTSPRVMQAHEWGKYVGRADFEFRNGEMKMVNYQLIPVNLKKKVTWEDGKSERVLYTPGVCRHDRERGD